MEFGAGAIYVRPLSRKLNLLGIANYDRLVGDVADSPLVREGDADQLFAGVFLSFRAY